MAEWKVLSYNHSLGVEDWLKLDVRHLLSVHHTVYLESQIEVK